MLFQSKKGTFGHKVIKQAEETKFSSKKRKKYAENNPLPTHSCRPGAYLVVEGVATGYASEYRTIAGRAVQTERGIVWVDSHKSAPPTAKSLPFTQHPDVWLLFITEDNINSWLNKLGKEASFEAFRRFLALFFLNFNPQRASRHPLKLHTSLTFKSLWVSPYYLNHFSSALK